MGRDIYDIINDMAEVLNASQMQKVQEVLVNRLSENSISDYFQTSNEEFLDMFLGYFVSCYCVYVLVRLEMKKNCGM